MKVLIDTNIILDVLCKRQGFFEDSAKVFRLCEIKQVTGIISALSIPNIVYIMRKELDAQKTHQVLEKLSLIFTIVDLKFDDLQKASDMNFKDYEDAVQSASAERVKADYIITRNVKDFATSVIAAVNPADFLSVITSIF